MNEELTTVNGQLKDKVEQLATLNDDLLNFVASTEIATLFLDTQKQIGRFTPATRRLFNLISTDIGRPLADIRPKFDDDNLAVDIDRVLETLQGAEREIVTDEDTWFLRRILPYRTTDNRIEGVVITFFDITRRRLSEQRLRESEARFRKLIENAPDAMVVVNKAGAIVLANSQALQFFGYGSDEMTGMPVETLIPQQFRDRHRQDRDGYFDRPRIREMGGDLELYALTKAGEEVPIEVMLSPMEAEDGQLVIAAIRDMSAVRAAINEARAAKATAETALSAKSRFLATASHDLRQPLQSLANTNAALTKLVDAPEAQRLLEVQHVSVTGMRALLNTLLDVSKLDAGAVAPDIQPIRLKPMLDALRDEIATEARDKDLTLKVTSPDLVVMSDAGLLKRLIQNILVNAVRYTDRGSILLDCTRDGDVVRITVTDTGRGIPTGELPHIFEEFYKIEGDDDRGLGLGLAIVKRIADILGVQVDVTSEPGTGTTFSVTVAATDVEPRPDTPEPARGVASSKGGVVLLVDDDPMVLDSTQVMLSLEPGLAVTAVTSAEEAYQALSRLSPDVIVTDMHLGSKINGIDVIREVRHRCGRFIPAILVTGDTSASVGQQDAKKLKILTKPTQGGALSKAIWQALAEASDEGGVGRRRPESEEETPGGTG